MTFRRWPLWRVILLAVACDLIGLSVVVWKVLNAPKDAAHYAGVYVRADIAALMFLGPAILLLIGWLLAKRFEIGGHA